MTGRLHTDRSVSGVTGSTIKIDKWGDSEGNFSVLALKKQDFTTDTFSCVHHMVPVGFFIQGEDLPVSELSSFKL